MGLVSLLLLLLSWDLFVFPLVLLLTRGLSFIVSLLLSSSSASPFMGLVFFIASSFMGLIFPLLFLLSWGLFFFFPSRFFFHGTCLFSSRFFFHGTCLFSSASPFMGLVFALLSSSFMGLYVHRNQRAY